jgi:thiamine biosynthesis lipoprotein
VLPERVAAEFPAMGGVVDVQIVDADATAVARVQALFAQYEEMLSRFRPDSELCALNESSGTQFAASSVLYDAVDEALGWACATDGVFDPTIIDDLEQAGYDRTFEAIAAGRVLTRTKPSAPQGERRWRDIALDMERNAITLPAGVRIDLGGIGKGFTVDRAIAAIGVGANAMVNASGDLYAAGPGPEGHGWYVGVEDPFDSGRDMCLLNVNDRGVATSGSIKRHWTMSDTRYHHLIDTRSGTSAQSDLLTVTAVALTATHADVLAKTAFLLGPEQGLRFVARFPDAECMAVTSRGDVLTTDGFGDYLA